MNGIYILLTILLYFGILLLVARLTGRHSDNDAFFRGNRRSPWYIVSFGMIGASLSGVTFVSVPGMVRGIDMTYMLFARSGRNPFYRRPSGESRSRPYIRYFDFSVPSPRSAAELR